MALFALTPQEFTFLCLLTFCLDWASLLLQGLLFCLLPF